MSYNLRRSGNFNGMGGRGRAGIQNNFISSGQYQQNMKPGAPPGGMVRVPQQYRQQGPTRPPYQPLRQPHNPLPSAPLKSALKKEVKTENNQNNVQQLQNKPVQQAPVAQPAPVPQQQQQPQQPKPSPQNIPPPQIENPPKTVPQSQPQQPPSSKPEPQLMEQQPIQQEQQQQQPQPIQQQQPVQQDVAPTSTPQLTKMEDIQKITKFFSSTMPSTKTETIEENGEIKKKTLILKGKISKKEKRGRRNKRLRKILVPKNALMVLNELVGGHKFQFLDKEAMPQQNFYIEPDTYVASVNIEGTDHVGYGKSKATAKTAAAENALRHIILSKINTTTSTPSVDGDDQMEVDGEKDEEDVSWLHVASFAMHKLFSTWYAEGDEKIEQAKILARTGTAQEMAKLQDMKQFPVGGPPKTRKPAKQLPQNPQLLNPVMLLNQMRDDVTYEEFSKTGTAPHIVFIIKTTVDGQDFYGKGGNKKVARKNCAFAACSRLYDLQYPMEEYDPSFASVGVPMF